jgi:hypothetical protein
LFLLDSGVVERELENALVQRGPQVVDDLTQRDREVTGDWHVQFEEMDVLRSTWLYCTANAVGVRNGVDISHLRGGESLRLLIRAFDFEANRRNSREIKLTNAD